MTMSKKEVACTDCGAKLDEHPNLTTTENKKPCPKCGSKARTFTVTAIDTIGLDALASTSGLGAVMSAFGLLLKTVVMPSQGVDKGRLVEAVNLPWFEIVQAIIDRPSFAYEISGRKWEEIIAGAYRKAGFDEVILTPQSGDLGRDVIAIKRGLGIVRIIDQVKAYNPKRLVTADDVRALLGVLQGDKASKGFLTTTSDFAPRLREDILLKPFMPAQLELINGKMLIKRLEEIARMK